MHLQVSLYSYIDITLLVTLSILAIREDIICSVFSVALSDIF